MQNGACARQETELKCSNLPYGAERHTNDNQDLKTNSNLIAKYSESNTSEKCEYKCRGEYEWHNGGCKAVYKCLPNPMASNLTDKEYVKKICADNSTKHSCESSGWDGLMSYRCKQSRGGYCINDYSYDNSFGNGHSRFHNYGPDARIQYGKIIMPTKCKWMRWDGFQDGGNKGFLIDDLPRENFEGSEVYN